MKASGEEAPRRKRKMGRAAHLKISNVPLLFSLLISLLSHLQLITKWGGACFYFLRLRAFLNVELYQKITHIYWNYWLYSFIIFEYWIYFEI